MATTEMSYDQVIEEARAQDDLFRGILADTAPIGAAMQLQGTCYGSLGGAEEQRQRLQGVELRLRSAGSAKDYRAAKERLAEVKPRTVKLIRAHQDKIESLRSQIAVLEDQQRAAAQELEAAEAPFAEMATARRWLTADRCLPPAIREEVDRLMRVALGSRFGEVQRLNNEAAKLEAQGGRRPGSPQALKAAELREQIRSIASITPAHAAQLRQLRAFYLADRTRPEDLADIDPVNPT